MRLKTLKETIIEFVKGNLGVILVVSTTLFILIALFTGEVVMHLGKAMIYSDAIKTAAESLSQIELTIGGAK
jgi:hypothetical protein